MNLERIREHPARYAIPGVLTVARPIVGALALAEARKGHWEKAGVLFAAAALADLDGTAARWLNACSTFGAKADPVADGVLRGEALLSLVPKIPITAAIVTATEAYNLWQNRKIQKGREKPLVPLEAKIGTGVQSVGAGVVFHALSHENTKLRLTGEAAMLAGTMLRADAYTKEHKKLKK